MKCIISNSPEQVEAMAALELAQWRFELEQRA